MKENPSSPSPAKSSDDLTERHRLLVAWNDTGTDYPRDKCVHELFEEQAERTPDAVALVFEDQQLTYRELNRRANHLAHTLRELGVELETLVGVCLERSPEMIVALLGVLKAGGAYVPLDPSYPKERLSFMIEDTRAPVLLTQERLVGELPRHAARLICLDADWPVIPREREENPDSGVTSDNLAYVIYTSGSTGVPKGVCVEHRPIVRLVRNTDYLEFRTDDVFLQLAPVAFDASTLEVWGPLLNGGRLALAPPGRLGLAEIAASVRRHGVTTLWLTAGLFHQMVDADPAALRGVRTLLAGGDVLSLAHVREALRHLPGTCLVNGYGPTENTTFTCCFPMSAADPPPDGTVPIGKPIANTRVYILDAQRRPVPVGIAGELYAGGDGLARGYLNRPELTAEKFVPDPFSEEPGARLYKTGDLARYLTDGNIEFLGRLDEQVKVRGYRIEPGEVEAVLAQHPAVRQSVVVAREDEPGEEKRLVAYIVSEREPKTSELHGFLKAKLPEHMVPAAFLALEELPLTPNGKVDRRALPAPDAARPELDEAFAPARTALERFLASSWQDILGIERVGVHDNFFELGGDSIRGAIFLNQLQQALGEVVSMSTIFDAPTIAGLVVYLNQYYPDAVTRLRDTKSSDGAEGVTQVSGDPAASEQAQRTNAAYIARIRRQTKPLPSRQKRDEAAGPKNPPAIFILSPPRSGSTLLRVMLGGHPGLFAPPELELLSFNTLAERKAALAGRYSFWLEGTIRAIMALKGCDAEEAKRTMEDWESRGLTTAQCYRLMQTWMGDRKLVDKTTSYPFNLETLKRAEADFDQALYIHLSRHPWTTIRSFEEAKLDRIFFGEEHSFSVQELAESIWLISHQNILEFLKNVPNHRQYRLKFEELVDQPRSVAEGLCQFLGLAFHPDMLQPYGDRETRMTDGIHPGSKMLGDPKFHQNQGIDAKAADRWRADSTEDFLGDVTWQFARLLGYERPDGPGRKFDSSDDAPTRKALGIPALPRHSESGQPVVFPLSPAQSPLWFREQRSPGSSYPGTPTLRLRGPLDIAALEASLREICARHEALRTTFDTRDGEPVQIVGPPRPVHLTRVDLRELLPPAREKEAGRLLVREAERPFDLSRGPMLRATLLRLDDEEHVLLLVVHHIVCDGWSLDVLFRELQDLYRALRSGERANLPELPVQYADYAVWQRQRLQDGALRQSMEYWKKQLADTPKKGLDLPTNRPRPPVRTSGGAWQELRMPASLLRELHALCRRQNVTLFVAVLAGWATLLHRYSGQDDILVASPVANRNRVEVEGLIGPFANNLVLRHDLAGDPSFAKLLGRVRETAVEALLHGELPFSELIKESRSSPRVVFQLRRLYAPKLDGLQVERIPIDHAGRLRSLGLLMFEGDKDLTARLNYDPDLFEAATAARMLEDLRTLLESVVADPEQHVSELPLPVRPERPARSGGRQAWFGKRLRRRKQLRHAARSTRRRLRRAARSARRRLRHAGQRARRTIGRLRARIKNGPFFG